MIDEINIRGGLPDGPACALILTADGRDEGARAAPDESADQFAIRVLRRAEELDAATIVFGGLPPELDEQAP